MRPLRIVLLSLLAALIGWATSPTSEGRAAPPPGQIAPTLDLSQPGAHRSGRWEYRLIVVAPGSKSEGYRGELYVDGTKVRDGIVGDYYLTPWGAIGWVGDPVTLWGEHGWMPRDSGSTFGRQLEPPAAASPPVVMALVLGAGSDGIPLRVDAWVREGMSALAQPSFHIEHPWLVLTEDAHVVHDTKMDGTLAIRLEPARDGDGLSVLLDGSSPTRVALARVDGATRVVKHTLDAGLDPLDLWIALRVERAGVGWPAPLEIGPEADGRTVVVRDVAQVLVTLPGDRDSGLVWIVKSLDGTALARVGEPRFTPAIPPTPGRGGTYDNAFDVIGTGTVELALGLRRPWQDGVAPAKPFRITLEVARRPPPGAM